MVAAGLKMLLLDWDGVMIESHCFYYRQIKTVFQRYSVRCPSLRTFKKWVSVLGVEGFYRKYGIKASFPEIKEIEEEYRDNHLLEEITIPYDAHVLIAVCKTRGVKTVILSNNFKGVINKILKRDLLFVDEVCSSKDKAKSIEEFIEKYGVERERIIFVGDTVQDILAGKRAGVKTVGYSGGYHTHAQIKEADPDYGGERKICSLQEITKIVFQLT